MLSLRPLPHEWQPALVQWLGLRAWGVGSKRTGGWESPHHRLLAPGESVKKPTWCQEKTPLWRRPGKDGRAGNVGGAYVEPEVPAMAGFPGGTARYPACRWKPCQRGRLQLPLPPVWWGGELAGQSRQRVDCRCRWCGMALSRCSSMTRWQTGSWLLYQYWSTLLSSVDWMGRNYTSSSESKISIYLLTCRGIEKCVYKPIK